MGRAINEDLMLFRRVEGGFEVFMAHGGVETRIDELMIGKTAARSKAAGEELRRFVEEAERTVPDLSGIKKMWQTLEWFATDMSFHGRQIVGGTAHLWQLRWCFALFGEGRIGGGGANVTRKGNRPNVTMYWPRERSDDIIAAEGEELKPLLGRAVKSWRELVDTIDWSWVVERVEELADELKPWIGPERASDEEGEELVRRILGELALLAHFAEARRGKDDDMWHAERAKRLAKAVEALSGGRIRGEYAERLAKLIIYYAEGDKKEAEKRIENLAKEVGVSREEVWHVVDFALSDMYCLARDCARDEVVRKFVAPALELIMLDKALNEEFDREEARLLFGEMYATAVAGDGHVGRRSAELAVGGELGGGAALLRLATLLLLSQLLSNGLGVRTYVVRDRYYYIATYGGDAARFKRLLAVSAPSAGGEYLSDKFNEFVKDARIEVQFDKNSLRLAEGGRVAADLTISEGDIKIKYNVYLRRDILLQFRSTDRRRVELAARLLRLAGISAEVKKEGGRDVWYVEATTDVLATGREELRKALAEVVREAIARGRVGTGEAEGWLKKLERGHVLKEGWPKYSVALAEGASMVRFSSTNLYSIEREARRLRETGLKEGRHFAVKMPEEGRDGYVRILKEGLARAARLSVRGKDEQQRRLAADFVKYILERAEEADKEVSEKAQKIIEEGMSRGSLTLKGFEREVEVNGEKYKVKVIDGEAVEEDRGGRKLLRIKITAEVDGVRRDYTITYGRYNKNAAKGFAVERAEADAERHSALVEALTGNRPRVYRMKDGRIRIECYEGHLEGFMRYDELADAIEEWLEETDQ
jgi:hypothetical protein